MSSINVQGWLEDCQSQATSIYCEDPEIVDKPGGSMLRIGALKKSHVTYRIKYKQPGRDAMTVRHRYSEFENIRSELRERYHSLGIMVPALPKKHSMNNAAMSQLLGTDLQETFVKERTLGLSIFCESIVHIPWLWHDSSWKAFLRPQSTVEYSDATNTGYTQLLACLQNMELSDRSTMSARIESIKEELVSMDKHGTTHTSHLVYFLVALLMPSPSPL
jgi:hypothetical protein